MTTAAEQGLEQTARHTAVMFEQLRNEYSDDGRMRQRGHANLAARLLKKWVDRYIEQMNKEYHVEKN